MGKKSKYSAKRTAVDGIIFASKREAQRYIILRAKAREGLITDLILQPKFILQDKFRYEGKGVREIAYLADFQYVDSDGTTVVEDSKGFRTEGYAIKAKWFICKYAKPNGWKFREV